MTQPQKAPARFDTVPLLAEGLQASRFVSLSWQEQAECAARMVSAMKVLANRERLLILRELLSGQKTVGQLATHLGRSQPAMSNNLALLSGFEIVSGRPDGTRVHYSIDRTMQPAVAALIAALLD